MRAFAVLLAVLAVVATAAVVGSLGVATEDAEAAPWTLAEPMSQRRSYIAAAQVGRDGAGRAEEISEGEQAREGERLEQKTADS